MNPGAIKNFRSADELNSLMGAYNKHPAWTSGRLKRK
jgi:hypothetical protein